MVRVQPRPYLLQYACTDSWNSSNICRYCRRFRSVTVTFSTDAGLDVQQLDVAEHVRGSASRRS